METMTIGQLAQKAQVNVETIRYYERRGLVPKPPRRESGYRQYVRNDVDRIRFIKRAQGLGFTLQEITELFELRVDPDTTCAAIKAQAETKIVDISEKIKTLQRMRKVLVQLTTACDSEAPTGLCPILESLEMEDVEDAQS